MDNTCTMFDSWSGFKSESVQHVSSFLKDLRRLYNLSRDILQHRCKKGQPTVRILRMQRVGTPDLHLATGNADHLRTSPSATNENITNSGGSIEICDAIGLNIEKPIRYSHQCRRQNTCIPKRRTLHAGDNSDLPEKPSRAHTQRAQNDRLD